MLLAAPDRGAAQAHVRSFVLERHADFAPRDKPAGGEGERLEFHLAGKPRQQERKVDRLVALLLRGDEADLGALADLKLGHGVGLVGDAVGAGEGREERRLGARADRDLVAERLQARLARRRRRSRSRPDA